MVKLHEMLAIAGLLGAATTARANAVVLSSSIEAGTISQEFSSGTVLEVMLYLASADLPLFGGELAVSPATEDIAVSSIAFNPDFSAAIGEESGDTSTNGIECAQVQPLRAINHGLGADGAAMHFATLELEVLNGGRFESALVVRARGALVGEIPERTVVLGNPSGEDGWGEGRIEIINTVSAPPSEVTQPWVAEQATASIEVRPVGGGPAVTRLTPNAEYEIHYAAGGAVNGFDLIVTHGPLLGGGGSDSAESTATEPGFDLCWAGAEVIELEPDAADGSPRIAVSADAIGSADSSELTADSLICSFMTGPSGWIDLDLRLYSTDPATRSVVEMAASAGYDIQ